MAKPSIKYITSADLFSIHFVPTLIVFLVMMVLIGFSWRTATQVIADTEKEQVEIRSQFVESNLKQRLETYENLLRSGAGLFSGSTEVTYKEWEAFATTQDVSERFPAAIGLGYVELVKPGDLSSYVKKINQQGFADYKLLSPDPPRDQYALVTYIDPLNDRNRQVLGGDIYNDPGRRAVIERARDENTVTVSDVMSISQTDGSRKNGFYAYFPVYKKGMSIDTVEERRQAIQGYIYAPFMADVLFGGILKNDAPSFNFRVYDGDTLTPETLLYERYAPDPLDPYTTIKSSIVEVDNQSWKILYDSRIEIVPETIRQRPNSIALGGIIFSMLVAGVVFLLLQRRSRQLADNENKKLDYAKDSMLSLASHQLRTPATGVKQYLGMVLEGFAGDITDDQKELLQRANDSNERQLRIINEFLYLAKADAGRIIVSPQLFDIGDLTDSILAEMGNNIALAGHKISVVQRAKVVNVFADPHSARMIIENLISNAIKYTPSGGKIIVTISKNRTSGVVSVKDNGVGIARKDFGKLFKQFSRIPNELTRQETGSGIGLYLADYLAELNGGKITVESKRHVGSIFSVNLPARAVKNITVT